MFKALSVFFIIAMISSAAMAVAPVRWTNLDSAHHLAGKTVSEGYLCGKIVVVDRWGARCPPCRRLLPRLEVLWQSFNDRPFVLLGGHCRGWGTADQVKRLAEKYGLTYPIYEEGCLARREPRFEAIPFIYVVDPTGVVLYSGNDEREATDTLVSAMADIMEPSNLERWKYHLAYEIDLLPARGLIRLREFARKFPKEAEDYATARKSLEQIPDIEDLVKLVEIVRKVRAYRPKDDVDQRRLLVRIDETISKYTTLMGHSDPRVAQEAKNALADLQWAKTER